MNKMRKVSIAAALLASAGAMSLSAIAGPGHNHGNKGQHKEKMFQALELTDAQRAQMDARKVQRKASRTASKERMKNLKQQIQETMKQEQLDQGRLRGLLAQEAELKADKMAAKHASRQEFQAMLTDSQKAKFAELKEQMKDRRQQHREKRQERRAKRVEGKDKS